MAHKLPLCAKCGKHMRHSGRDRCEQGRILLEYGSMPGTPTVGWHEDCIQRDRRMWDRFMADMKRDGAELSVALLLLRQIRKRGPGRVRGWPDAVNS